MTRKHSSMRRFATAATPTAAFLVAAMLVAVMTIAGCGKKTGNETVSAPEVKPAPETSPEALEPAPRGEPQETGQAAEPELKPDLKPGTKPEAAPAAKQSVKKTAKKAEGKPAEEAGRVGGVVTFLSGKVTVNRGQSWAALDVEDAVRMDDRVKTAQDSFCEIQFSDFGTIRVQESSEILVGNVALVEGESKVDVNLKGGNLLCKVNKLGKGEEFRVKTSTALAGVRGTEFAVREQTGKGTVIAVKEGQVTVVPSQIVDRLESLKNELETETARAVLDEIAIPEIIVTDKMEVEFEKEEVDKAVKKFEEVSPILERKIKEIDQKAAAVQAKEDEIRAASGKSAEEKSKELADVAKEKKGIAAIGESVVTQVEKKTAEIQRELERPESVSKTSLKELDEIKKMKPREIAVSSKDGTEAGGRTGPSGAQRKGAPRAEEVPLYVKISVDVKPKDADIFVNDENVGKNRYSGLYPPGTILVIRAAREGYKTNVYKYTVTDQRNQKVEIELRSPVSWVIREGSSPFVRKMARSGSSAVLADRKGRLVCVSTSGKKQWVYSTKNDPNENSMPVIVDDRVVFSGAAELVSLNMQSGDLVKGVPLGSGRYSSHLFGRRVVPLGPDLLFPSDEELLLLEKSTMRETASIGIPGASLCSPAVSGGKVIVVNQLGELLVLNPAGGAVEARIQTDAFQPASLAPTVVDNVVVFGDTRGKVVAVDLKQGVILWQRDLASGGTGFFTDIEAEGESLYAYTGQEFYTISILDGRDISGPVASSCLPLVRGGRIYFGDKDGRFLMTDAVTGKILKSYMMGSPVVVQPLLVEDISPQGGVILGTESGTVSMLDLADL